MLFSYKFFTLSQPLFQLPNKFYFRKSTTTTHTPPPPENPPLSTQNPPPHNTETTKTPPPTPPQQQQKNQRLSRSAREQIDKRVIGDQADRRWSDPVQKGEGDRERVRLAARTENSAARSRRCVWGWGAISPLHLGLGCCLLSLLSLLSLSLCHSAAFVSPFFSLSFSLCASMSSGSDLKVK